MSESEAEPNEFMRFWFSGLINGLESVDEPARETILRECGKACASSYTAGVFKEAKEMSGDMESFLAALAERFPGSTYELVAAKPLGAETIRVRYSSCGCDLVESGLVESALICGCSAHNLRENFERALNRPVTVSLVSSILQGAGECEFLVLLDSAR